VGFMKPTAILFLRSDDAKVAHDAAVPVYGDS
jgi:hypothetical protein